MIEKLVQTKNSNLILDLNDTKNYTCWVLKSKDKDPIPNSISIENKNIISYGAVGLYLQKMEKKQFNPNNIKTKYYEIKFNNLMSDIFPFERNPEINFMYYNSQFENLFGENRYENKKSNYSDKKLEALRKQMINDDIPEMILYKYKYDKKLFDELNEDWQDEPEFIFELIKDNKKYKILNKTEVTTCIQKLLNKHKVEFLDIPYIVKECNSLYNYIFNEEQVFAILSLYDALYIQYKLKQMKIQKLHNQLVLTTNDINKIDFSFTNEAKTDLDLNLALSYIGYSISLLNYNSKTKFCDNLLDLNINLNSKKLLQSSLEDECDNIINKFCLSPEDVAYNLKILNKEINGKIKEPNKDCLIMDICSKKVIDLLRKNKKYHPIQILQKAINYYIISLSSHPYIAKLIFNYFLNAANICTYPTEKGKILLNYSNPSFKVKNIEKQDLFTFISSLKKNENDYSETYLDIEKCEKEGLIKCDIEINMKSKKNEELIKLLNYAVNGKSDYFFDFLEKNPQNKNINTSDSDESEINKIKIDIEKNTLVRKIAIKNMILDKEFTQKYFINYIKKECHDIAEKYLIEKISNKFYNEVLVRKHIRQRKNEVNEENKYYYSIFFINENTFCYVAIDKNKKIKFKNILKANIVYNKQNELKNEMEAHKPKFIILGINNIGAYKLINYFTVNESIIYSDYLSLFKMPKQYDINFTNEKEYFYTIALDQFKYTMNPLEFFIENYHFKYEKNLILNLKLHYLQEQINDIPLLNYCLEMQIRRSLNLYKFRYEKGKNPIENYYSFMNGLGPLTSKLIDDYKNKPIMELTNVTGNNILTNIYNLIHDNINIMGLEDESNFIYHFQEEDIFNKMINSFHLIKRNSIHNVFVMDIDAPNNLINCVLLYNENFIKCTLHYNNIDNYINDIYSYFHRFRILLCKIIYVEIQQSGVGIKLSNKIESLEYLENCNEEVESYMDENNIKENNKIIPIHKLKNIINSQKNKSEKYLKKINEDENYFYKNTTLEEIKKDYITIDESGKFCFRPSYLGPDYLILTFSFCEHLTLNYNVSLEKKDKFILEDVEYNSINDIVKNFANPLLKVINQFKQNKYFRTPTQMQSIYNKIFSHYYNNNINLNSTKEKEKAITYDNINLCFMDDSPNYGMLLTKNKNNCVNIDYIEFIPNGFYFHNKLFNDISLIIEYYLENNDKQSYKEFICENIIPDVHSKLEFIDLQYKEFDDQMLKKLDWGIKDNNNNEKEKEKKDEIFLGKKRNDLGFDGWGNNNNKNQNKNGNGKINKIIDDNSDNFWSNDIVNNNDNDNYNNKSNENNNNNNNNISWNNNNNSNENKNNEKIFLWSNDENDENDNNNNNNNNNSWSTNNNNNTESNNNWEQSWNDYKNSKISKNNNFRDNKRKSNENNWNQNNNNYNNNWNNNKFNQNKNNNFNDNNNRYQNNKLNINGINQQASKLSWVSNTNLENNNNSKKQNNDDFGWGKNSAQDYNGWRVENENNDSNNNMNESQWSNNNKEDNNNNNNNTWGNNKNYNNDSWKNYPEQENNARSNSYNGWGKRSEQDYNGWEVEIKNNNSNNNMNESHWSNNNNNKNNNDTLVIPKNAGDDCWGNISEQDNNRWSNSNNCWENSSEWRVDDNSNNNMNEPEWSVNYENKTDNNNNFNYWYNPQKNNYTNNNRNHNSHNNSKNNSKNKSVFSGWNNNSNNNNKIFNCSNDNYYSNVPFNKNNSNFRNNDNNNNNLNNNRFNNSSKFHFSKNNNNNNSFNNQRNKSYKFNKKKGNWANEYNNDRVKDDIKNDEDQGPIDFENVDEFGGYNVKNDEYENNNVNNNTQNEQQKINIKDDDLNW